MRNTQRERERGESGDSACEKQREIERTRARERMRETKGERERGRERLSVDLSPSFRAFFWALSLLHNSPESDHKGVGVINYVVGQFITGNVGGTSAGQTSRRAGKRVDTLAGARADGWPGGRAGRTASRRTLIVPHTTSLACCLPPSVVFSPVHFPCKSTSTPRS